jgi:hypothetical protein
MSRKITTSSVSLAAFAPVPAHHVIRRIVFLELNIYLHILGLAVRTRVFEDLFYCVFFK